MRDYRVSDIVFRYLLAGAGMTAGIFVSLGIKTALQGRTYDAAKYITASLGILLGAEICRAWKNRIIQKEDLTNRLH